jgi:hypothetical protein
MPVNRKSLDRVFSAGFSSYHPGQAYPVYPTNMYTLEEEEAFRHGWKAAEEKYTRDQQDDWEEFRRSCPWKTYNGAGYFCDAIETDCENAEDCAIYYALRR